MASVDSESVGFLAGVRPVAVHSGRAIRVSWQALESCVCATPLLPWETVEPLGWTGASGTCRDLPHLRSVAIDQAP